MKTEVTTNSNFKRNTAIQIIALLLIGFGSGVMFESKTTPKIHLCNIQAR